MCILLQMTNRECMCLSRDCRLMLLIKGLLIGREIYILFSSHYIHCPRWNPTFRISASINHGQFCCCVLERKNFEMQVCEKTWLNAIIGIGGDAIMKQIFIKMKFLVVSLLPIKTSLTWKNAEFSGEYKEPWLQKTMILHSKLKTAIKYGSLDISESAYFPPRPNKLRG